MKTSFRSWAKTAAMSVACALTMTSVCRTEAQELKQIFDPPSVGTFFLISHHFDGEAFSPDAYPPFPMDPYEGTMEILQLDGLSDHFLIMDSMESFLALRALKAAGVPAARVEWSALSTEELVLLSEAGASEPQGAGGGFAQMSYTSSDL